MWSRDVLNGSPLDADHSETCLQVICFYRLQVMSIFRHGCAADASPPVDGGEFLWRFLALFQPVNEHRL